MGKEDVGANYDDKSQTAPITVLYQKESSSSYYCDFDHQLFERSELLIMIINSSSVHLFEPLKSVVNHPD